MRPTNPTWRRAFKRFESYRPGAMEQLERWVKLLDNPRYRAWVEHGLEDIQAYIDNRPGRVDVFADYEKYMDEWKEVSHEPHAMAGLRSKGWMLIARLWPGNNVAYDHYDDLTSIIVGLMLLERPRVWTREEIRIQYGVVDRVLFGGRAFTRVQRVPRVNTAYFVGLRTTHLVGVFRQTAPQRYLAGLDAVKEALGRAWKGREYIRIGALELAALGVLTVANAYRAGRKKVTYEDGYEAVETILALFEHGDLFSIQSPEREGEPYRGYGKDPRYAVPE